MSAQYPMLDNRPINKWKVTELREELKRRNLTTKGLKDELVKRLDEAIRIERAAEETEEPIHPDDGSDVGSSGDTKVGSDSVQIASEASEHEENEVKNLDEAATRVDVDDGPTKVDQGEVSKQEGNVGPEPITKAGESSVVEAPPAVSNSRDGVVLHITSSKGTLANKNISQDNEVLEYSRKDAVSVNDPIILEVAMQNIGELEDTQVHQTLDDENIMTPNNEVEKTDLSPEKAVENIAVEPDNIPIKSSEKDGGYSVQIANEASEHGENEVKNLDEAATMVDVDDGPTKVDQGEVLKQEGNVGPEPITEAGESSVVEASPSISNSQDAVVLHITSSEGTLANKNISQDNAVLESSRKDAVSPNEPIILEVAMQNVGELEDTQVHRTLDDKNIMTPNNEVERTDLSPEKAVENIAVEQENISIESSEKDGSYSVQIANEASEYGENEVKNLDEAATRTDVDDGPTKGDQGEVLKQEGNVGPEPITEDGESSVVEASPSISNSQDAVLHITSSEGTLANKNISQDNAVLESSRKDAVLANEPIILEVTMQNVGELEDTQVHRTLDDKNIMTPNNEVEKTDLSPEKAVENIAVEPENISIKSSEKDEVTMQNIAELEDTQVHQTLDDKNIMTHNNEVERTDFSPEKAVENIAVEPENISIKSFEKDAVLVGELVTSEATLQSIGEVVDSPVHQALQEKNIKICDIEVEGTDLPPDKAAESIEVKPDDISLKSSQMDAGRGLPYSNDKVYEVSHNLGLQVKSESFSNDTLTVNEKIELKENLTADDVQLEPEIIRPEMVQPSSSRDPPGDGIVHPSDDPVPHGNQTLDGETNDDKSKDIEFSKKNDNADEMSVDVLVVEHNLENEASAKVEHGNELNQLSFVKDTIPVSGLSPEQREPSAEERIDVDISDEGRNPQVDNDPSKTTVGADGDLLEKVNLDQSSGDDSMEEDMSEAKHVDSDRVSSKVGEKTYLNKEAGIIEGGNIHVTQHIASSDNLESSDPHKDSGTTLSEKRKFQEAENKEPHKRQRKWNIDNQEVSGNQSSGAIISPRGKASLLTASEKPNLNRSDSKLGGEAPEERVVPASEKTPTTSLRIDNFLRPFTLKAVQELLAKTGTFSTFWMDHIKTHCYVTYSSVDEAIETRNALYNLQWPPNGGRHLVADFVDPEEVKLRADAPRSAAPSVNKSTSATAQAPLQQAIPTPQHLPRQHAEPQHPLSREPPVRDSSTKKEQLPRAQSPVAEKPDPPIVTLDDLFRKTRATPRIYYLPLTDEQVAAKLARQTKERQ